MQFDKEAVLGAVKSQLGPVEKAQKSNLEFSLALALDDLNLRLNSDSFLDTYTETLSSGDQEINLQGKNLDLRHIYALMISSGDTKRLLTFKDQKVFLRDFESDNQISAGIPEYYTQLTSEDGFPTIRFERVLNASATLTVYYYTGMTDDNLAKARTLSPIVNATLAYFFGITSQKGVNYYAIYKNLSELMRSQDKFLNDNDSSIELNILDKNVKDIQRGYRNRRN